jgi:hydrogenase maturation protease
MDTLIFGMGNPYRGDDSIGWRVAEELRNRFKFKKNYLDIQKGNIGVFNLLDLSLDYRRLVIIDSAEMPGYKVGEVKFFSLLDLNNGKFPLSHLIDLKTAWVLWQKRFEYPERIDVFAIQIKDRVEFNSCLSSALERKFPDIIKKISKKLKLNLKNSYSN